MSAAFPQSVVVSVRDDSAVGEARRAARALARELGLAELAAEQAALVATEASRNVVLHGGGGELVLTPCAGGGALDVLALDRGPGIACLAQALRDGYSTTGTAGQGLGAIARIAAVFDVYTALGAGTALLARVGAPPAGPVEIGAVCVAVATERVCGDAWALAVPDGRPVVLVVDGLGHGPRAAEAAEVAVAAFRAHATLAVDALLERVHAALRPTRGAAVAIAAGTGAGEAVRFAGIGNVAGLVWSAGVTRRMVTLPGTCGHEARTIRSFEYAWPADGVLVMHSDGIATHWDLEGYPGLAQRHPALVAGVLYRDHARRRDDGTVIAARRSP